MDYITEVKEHIPLDDLGESGLWYWEWAKCLQTPTQFSFMQGIFFNAC